MKTKHKIKGALRAADITLTEMAKLAGTAKQTLHKYLNTDCDIEDFEKGLKVLAITNKVVELTITGTLPLSRSLTKEQKLEQLQNLLG